MLSEEKFREKAEEAIRRQADAASVRDYSIHGFCINISFRTGDENTTWITRLDFSNGGSVDGHYTFTEPGKERRIEGPRMIGNAIMRKIQEELK